MLPKQMELKWKWKRERGRRKKKLPSHPYLPPTSLPKQL
jgi:hypothetical protein